VSGYLPVSRDESLGQLASYDFGRLIVVEMHGDYEDGTNAFEVYRDRALRELAKLRVRDVPTYLYGIARSR